MPETFLGFDFGTKRIGVSVGQTFTATAQPLKTMSYQYPDFPWETIRSYIIEWKPQGLVLGIPLNADGSEQAITQLARDFALALKAQFTLPVYLCDERYSTVEVKQLLFDQGGYKKLKDSEVDSWAAKLILESWLRKRVKDPL
jgi:putative Holliday junction resolvase